MDIMKMELMHGIKNSKVNLMWQVLPLIKGGQSEDAISILEAYHVDQPLNTSTSTLLHYSVGYNNTEVTEYLLNKGYDVNTKDSTGTTPLMVAVRKKHEIIEEFMIDILIDAGADVMVVNCWGQSLLRMAFENCCLTPIAQQVLLIAMSKKCYGHEETTQKLVDSGCHLYQAAYLGIEGVVERMLQLGFSVDFPDPISKQSPLHIALDWETVECAEILLKYGANVNVLDNSGFTPFYYLYSVDYEHTPEKIELINILLEAGASPTFCIPRGQFQASPILCHGSCDAVRLLLQANIDFQAKDNYNGRTVLQCIALNTNPGVFDVLKFYIDKFDANAVDNEGANALFHATSKFNAKVVKLLLRHGANPNCVFNSNGFTPLYCTLLMNKPGFEEQKDRCVEMLLEYHADPQITITDKNGEEFTVIDFAIIRNNRISSLKPVVAQLAILEGQGVPIKDMILRSINKNQTLNEYFNKCRKLLNRKICGSVTLLKLVTANRIKMVRYSGNRKLVFQLLRLGYRQQLKSSHPYYHNILKKRFAKSMQCRRYLSEVAPLICKMFGNRFDETNLIVDKMFSCLNDQSLKQLYQLCKK